MPGVHCVYTPSLPTPTHSAVPNPPYPGGRAVTAYGGYTIGVVFLACRQSTHNRADHLGGGAVVIGVSRGCGVWTTLPHWTSL